LLIQDFASETAKVHSVTTTDASGAPVESGLSVRQVEPDSDGAPSGDLRPVLTGTPEDEVEGRLVVVQPGVEGDARWGFTRTDDSSLQLRQSPQVVTHPDLLARESGLGAHRLVRPKLLSLASGNLLCVWLRQVSKTEDAGRGAGVGPAGIYRSAMSPNGSWSAPTELSIWYGRRDNMAVELFDFALVQYPDTGEVLAITVGTAHTQLATGFFRDRRLHVASSNSDAQSFQVKAEHVLMGSTPDISLGSDDTALLACTAQILASGRLLVVVATMKAVYSLVSDDRGRSFSRAATILTVSSGLKGNSSSHPDLHYCGLSSTMLPSGLCWVVLALGLDTDSYPFASGIYGWLTADGADYGTRQDIGHATPCPYTDAPAVVVRDDGWPQLYVQAHQWYVPDIGSVWSDLMATRTMATREPRMDHTAADLFPDVSQLAANYGGGDPPTFWALHPMHGHTLTGADGQLGNSVVIHYAGWAGGIAACLHRGSVYLANAYMHEGGTGSTATLVEAGIVVFRANNWQPLQECLALGFKLTTNGFSNSLSKSTTWGRAYHMGWDAQGSPDQWGWQKDQEVGGLIDMQVVDADHDQSATQLTGPVVYFRETLPNPNGADGEAEGKAGNAQLSGVVRFWVDVVEGGDLDFCAIGSRMVLVANGYAGGTETTTYGSAVEVRLKRASASAVDLRFVDTFKGDGIGSGATVQARVGDWIEVLYALDMDGQFKGWCFARVWRRDEDPDFLAEYKLVGQGTLSPYLSKDLSDERLSWGHVTGDATLTRTSRWKLVHLHRPDTQFFDGREAQTPPLAVRTRDWTHELTTTPIPSWLINKREPMWFLSRNDSGFVNLMRAAQATAGVGSGQWVEAGLRASWRGDAATPGAYVYRSGYDLGARNALVGSGAPWRIPALDTYGYVPEAVLVLDAGADGWGADALAVFGRSWPNMRLDLYGSDSEAGTPWRTMDFGLPLYPGGGAGLEEWHRDLSDWLIDPAVNGGYGVRFAYRMVYVSAGVTVTPNVWRPHQWRSDPNPGGPQFYFAVRVEGARGASSLSAPRVFRIVDNDHDRLYLDDNPLTYFPTWNVSGSGAGETERACIFSDRFAVSFANHFHSHDNVSGLTHRRRYLRVTIRGHWRSYLNPYAETRRFLFGRLADLSGPDFDWGWGFKVDPGVETRALPGGGRVVNELRPALRSFSCDYGQRRFSEGSTAFATPVRPTTPSTWNEVVELLAAARFGARQCALVWQGERALPSESQDRDFAPAGAANGYELMLVRPGGVEVRQIAFQCSQEALPSGASVSPQSVVRPWMAVRSLSFDEEV
jgi:hypothetical protein